MQFVIVWTLFYITHMLAGHEMSKKARLCWAGGRSMFVHRVLTYFSAERVQFGIACCAKPDDR
jgi:hypothetical protein